MLLTGRAAERPEAPLIRFLKRLLPADAARVRRPTRCWPVGSLVVAFVLTGARRTRLGQEFLPSFQETDFLMHFVEKPGTSRRGDDAR